jgi:hypothetical protein
MNRRIRRGAAVAGVAAVATLGLTALPAEAATATPFTINCYSVKNNEPIQVTGEWRTTRTTITVQHVVVHNGSRSWDAEITRMRLTDRKTKKYVNGVTGRVKHGDHSRPSWSPAKSFPRKDGVDLAVKGWTKPDPSDTWSCGARK